MSKSDGEVRFRARARAPFKVLGGRDAIEQNAAENRSGAVWGIAAFAIVPVIALIAGNAEEFWTSSLGIAGGLAVIVPIALYRLSMSVTVTDTEVRVKRWGPDLILPFERITRMVLVHISEYSGASASQDDRLLIFVGKDGHALGKISQRQYSLDVLTQVAHCTGRPLERRDKNVTGLVDLYNSIPHSISWVRAHPYLFGLVIFPLGLGAPVAAVVLVLWWAGVLT